MPLHLDIHSSISLTPCSTYFPQLTPSAFGLAKAMVLHHHLGQLFGSSQRRCRCYQAILAVTIYSNHIHVQREELQDKVILSPARCSELDLLCATREPQHRALADCRSTRLQLPLCVGRRLTLLLLEAIPPVSSVPLKSAT